MKLISTALACCLLLLAGCQDKNDPTKPTATAAASQAQR